MATCGLVAGVLVGWAVLFAGCDRRTGDPAPEASPQAPMQPLPQMPQPTLPTQAYPPAAIPQQTGQGGTADPRVPWDEQRITRLEQQVAGLAQDNQALHQQLAQTQAELRDTADAVRRMQGQASAARRTIQGYRNQFQQQ